MIKVVFAAIAASASGLAFAGVAPTPNLSVPTLGEFAIASLVIGLGVVAARFVKRK